MKENKMEENKRDCGINQEWEEYEEWKKLIARKPELEDLMIKLKNEQIKTDINGKYSEKFLLLKYQMNILPENEKKIMNREYEKFVSLGTTIHNDEFKINQYIEEITNKNNKKQQPNIEDRVECETIQEKVEMEEKPNPEIDEWMNKFNNWYGLLDRVTPKTKSVLIDMRSDIIEEITNMLK